jgi:CubicO group peptidase (beta-lactamase class C family)
MKKKRACGLMAGILAAMLGLTGVASADEPPDEQQILLEELPNIVQRTTMYALPPDPEGALEALSTLPQGADDVLAMHLGRLHPTPHESMPGVAPLVSLLGARADLLLDPQHHEKKLQDTSNGEVAILLLPIDATTAIVILPTQVVRADAGATPMPERRVDLSDVTYEVNGEERTVEQYMADGATNAIAFAHDGEFIFDAYQNGFTPDTRHQFWSMTKSVTTALVGIAVEEGLVESIHDPIERHIPDAAGTAWEGTTVENILQMKSGIYWVDVPIHQPEQLVAMGFDFHTNGLAGMTRNEYLLQLTRVSEPGVHKRYNSADTQMLAWLLENVYDDAYASILSEKLWRPAGMESDALIMVDRVGDAFASMGLFATAKDAIRFGELFRSGGRNLAGEQVVPEAWVEASTDYSEETGGPRGYQWAPWSHGYTAVGFGHQRIAVAPDLDMVGLRFGNDPIDTVAPKEWDALYLAVADHIGAGTADSTDPDPTDPDPRDPGGPNRPSDPGGPNGPNDPGAPGDPGKSDEEGKGGGTGGGRDDAPGQQVPQVQRGQLAASSTDVMPFLDVAPFLLVLSLALTVSAVLTRGRSAQR